MQEIYTMILNSSVTTVIAIIFLWQYVKEHTSKDNNEKKSDAAKEGNGKNVNNNLIGLIINKLDHISNKLEEIINLLQK